MIYWADPGFIGQRGNLSQLLGKADFGFDIYTLDEVVKAWPFLPDDIHDAIYYIVEHTMRKPTKVEALNLEVKRLYLELRRDSEHFHSQEAIIREIRKRTGIASRSTVMKHLAEIRRSDQSFPRKTGPKSRKQNRTEFFKK